MKKTLITVCSIFILFISNAQNIGVLNLIINDSAGNPMTFKNAHLYSSTKVMNWSFTDEKGELSFKIDTIPSNIDSVYFKIKTEDILSSDTKIFINKLNLFDRNKVENYIITIVGFHRFTVKEYQEFIKEYQLMPNRTKVIKKDIN